MPFLEELLSYLAPKPAPVAPPATPSATIGIVTDVGAVAQGVGAGLTAAGKVADLLKAHEADLNTPEMIDASEAKKLQLLVDRINRDLRVGNEEDLKKLEAE